MTSQRKRLVIIGCVLLVLLGGGAAWWLWPASRPTIMQGQGFGCWKVGQCSEQCALRCPAGLNKLKCLLGCKDRCTDRGCSSVRPIYKRLTDCVQKRCLWRCIGGPCPECNKCTEEKCPAERESCRKHRC